MKRNWTPVEIELLIQTFYVADGIKITTPARQKALQKLLKSDLVIHDDPLKHEQDDLVYLKMTEKGQVLIDDICATPMPVKKWVSGNER